MDWLGIPATTIDFEAWLAETSAYAWPLLLQSSGLIAVGAALFVVARWIMYRLESRFAARTKSLADDHILEGVRRCLSISIVMFVASRVLLLWELQAATRAAEAVWIVTLSVPLADLVTKLLRIVEERVVPQTETTIDDTALPLLNTFARYLIVAVAVVTALSHIHIDIMPFVAGASVAGVAIGFAAKDTLSNLIAGVLLILDRPFHVGDRIELWQAPRDTATWGDVIEIGLRATKIRNPDNLIFVIPNNQIMQRDIVNYTASGENIRLRIPIGIAYNADSQRAKGIIREVALGVDGIIPDPAPQVIIRNFGESAIDLELRVWIAEARERRRIGDEITDRVKTAFDQAGVEIPYAKRDLYIRSMPADVPSTSADPPDEAPETSQRRP